MPQRISDLAQPFKRIRSENRANFWLGFAFYLMTDLTFLS